MGKVTEAHLIDEVSAFRDKLYPRIAEIRKNLQSTNLVDLITTKGIMVSRLSDRALNYEFQLFSVCYTLEVLTQWRNIILIT